MLDCVERDAEALEYGGHLSGFLGESRMIRLTTIAVKSKIYHYSLHRSHRISFHVVTAICKHLRLLVVERYCRRTKNHQCII